MLQLMVRDDRGTLIMDTGWRIFEFSQQRPNNDMQKLPAYPKFFHDLPMLGSAN